MAGRVKRRGFVASWPFALGFLLVFVLFDPF